MTRKEKVDVLEWYCDHCGDTCDKCELKNIYAKKNGRIYKQLFLCI